MTMGRSWFAIALLLPGLAIAADQSMLELVMPDARAVMDINLDRIANSPIGQAMSAQMKAQISNMHPAGLDNLPGLANIDWSRFAQEVLIAMGKPGAAGQPGPAIVIVRGLLDPAWLETLHAFNGTKADYMGVPMVISGNGVSEKNPSSVSRAVAFLDGSLALIGTPADVKAAIRRRGQNAPPSPVLADGLARFEGQYDLWVVTEGQLNAGKSAGGPAMKWLEQVDAFTLGVKFSPDFDLAMDMTMRNEKDVADMASGLHWFAGVVQTQEKTVLASEDIKFKVDGKRISLALQVPEQQIRAAIAQRAGQGGHIARSTRVKPPEISSGMPEPPSGTIRVQSSPSDMGTALVTVKTQ